MITMITNFTNDPEFNSPLPHTVKPGATNEPEIVFADVANRRRVRAARQDGTQIFCHDSKDGLKPPKEPLPSEGSGRYNLYVETIHKNGVDWNPCKGKYVQNEPFNKDIRWEDYGGDNNFNDVITVISTTSR